MGEATVRVRLKDVAAASGVSTATVSLVLNEATDRISVKTVERVRKVATELGYSPNVAARSLRTNRTHTIGVVTDNVLTTPFGFRMVKGAQDAAWEQHYLLLMIGTEGDSALQHKATEALLARQVEGFLYGSMYHRTLNYGLETRRLPTVGFNAVAEGAASFVPDEVHAARQAVTLLTVHGHKRITHLTEHATDGLARGLRISGFRQGLADAGLSGGPVVEANTNGAAPLSVSAELVALDLLASDDRPTAIFAYNDQMAIGIYRAAHRLGVRIPEELSVVGFDDQENVASELSPGLTTMALPHYEMGRQATQALLNSINTGIPPVAGITLLPCPLVKRHSIAAHPPE